MTFEEWACTYADRLPVDERRVAFDAALSAIQDLTEKKLEGVIETWAACNCAHDVYMGLDSLSLAKEIGKIVILRAV